MSTPTHMQGLCVRWHIGTIAKRKTRTKNDRPCRGVSLITQLFQPRHIVGRSVAGERIQYDDIGAKT